MSPTSQGIYLGTIAALSLSIAGGCTSTAPRSPDQTRADAQTAAAVYRALKTNRTYFYPALEVRVDRGVTYLGGLTLDSLSYDAAPGIARHVPGVTRVVNAIELDVGRQ